MIAYLVGVVIGLLVALILILDRLGAAGDRELRGEE